MDNQKRVDTSPITTTEPLQRTDTRVGTRKISGWSTVAFFFMILLLLALGTAAWLWMSWREADDRAAAYKSDVVSAQSLVADLREQLGVKSGLAAQETTPANDEQLIKTAVTDYNNTLAAPLANAAIELTKRDGDQATARVSDTLSGYTVFLKKAKEAWVVVWAGQNTPPEAIVKQFNLKV